jgi:hypothetical protein
MKKIFVGLVILIILIAGVGGYFILFAGKPKDLGIRYTEDDRTSARAKSKIEYEALPETTPVTESIQRFGTREVTAEFSSAEVTALMNNRPWRFWPYANVQVKLNGDGSGEISGTLIKDRLPGYLTFIGVPQEAADFIIKFLPANPSFYLKIVASVENNQVALFDPKALEVNGLPLPVGQLLSFIRPAYAADSDMLSDLSKVKNKKSLIISFINKHLNKKGFFAKRAYVAENKLIFDGNLVEKEATLR